MTGDDTSWPGRFQRQIFNQGLHLFCKMSFEEVCAAHKRIMGFINKTPVLSSTTLNNSVGRQIFFKCENFQKTGSFKTRGSLNAVLKLVESNPKVAGVVTHSTGNHGQALAWAAKTAGIPCSVVIPNDAPSVKCQAIREYGAELVYCEPNPVSRQTTCQKVADETGKTIISAYDHYDVIAGQGTMAVELLEEQPDLDAILVPCSGGGMTSGVAIAAKHIRPQIKVFAVEPKGKELEPCLRTGERLWPNPPRFVDTIGDGIRTQQVGQLTFPIICRLCEKQVFTVTDEEMIKAMKFVFERMKLVIEPSSAAGVAAVMSESMKKLDPEIKKIGVIICGGNVDIDKLPW